MATQATATLPTGTVALSGSAIGSVNETLSSMRTAMGNYQTMFSNSYNALINATIPNVPFTPSIPNFTAKPVTQVGVASPVDVGVLNTISTNAPAAPSLTLDIGAAPTLGSLVPPTLVPVDISVQAPQSFSGSMPARPTLSALPSIPTAPSTASPVLPNLAEIQVPIFTAPVLATFRGKAPTWSDTGLSYPSLPAENAALTGRVKAALDAMQVVGPDVWAMFEEGRSREDRTASKNLAEAYDTFAARGYVAPPGVLLKTVSAIRETNQLQVNAMHRAAVIKAADVKVETARIAVTVAVECEKILADLLDHEKQRALEIAKHTIDAMIAAYNAKVAVFNASMSAYKTEADVYRITLEGQLATLEVFKTQMEGAKVGVEVNKGRVELYTAQVQGLLADAEVYKSRIQGVTAQADVVRSQLQAYQADIAAFSESVNAHRAQVDAYKATVEAQGAKAQVNASSAQVFASLVAAEASQVELWSKTTQVGIEKFKAETANYGAVVDGYRAMVAGQVARVEGEVALKKVSLENTVAQNQANIAAYSASIQGNEFTLQSNLAAANTSIKLYETVQSRILAEADMRRSSLTSAAQMASTLAAGAMAAQHVQASVGYSESASISASHSEAISNALNENRSL